MIDTHQIIQAGTQWWPVIVIAAAWIMRERLNILALGEWITDSGGLFGIAKKLLLGNKDAAKGKPS